MLKVDVPQRRDAPERREQAQQVQQQVRRPRAVSGIGQFARAAEAVDVFVDRRTLDIADQQCRVVQKAKAEAVLATTDGTHAICQSPPCKLTP
jgi:hypothetical protein